MSTKNPVPDHSDQQSSTRIARDERLLLQQMAKLGGGSVTEDRAIAEVLHLMSELIGLNRGRVLLFQEQQLRITHAYGLTKEQISKGKFLPNEGITGKAFASGRVVIIQDIDNEPGYLTRTVQRAHLPQETVSYIALPFQIQGKTAGVLAAHRLRNRPRSLADDVDLMGMIAAWIAQLLTVNRLVAARTATLQNENIRLKEQLGQQSATAAIIGNSAATLSALKQVEQVANSDATVLLLGESGTGKELFAHALHSGSPRLAFPFIKINCGAIPESLFESELFGHEKGAFTGALTKRIGRIEQAHQGTLFLDEVGDLPLPMQVKLLRVLQDRVIERLGGNVEIPINIRIVAATHRDLASLVAQGSFRLDLYYRLSVIPIKLPALRERIEDIPAIAWHHLSDLNLRYGKQAQLNRDAMAVFSQYHWPGNIRQLRNTLERLVLLVSAPSPTAPLITAEDVNTIMQAWSSDSQAPALPVVKSSARTFGSPISEPTLDDILFAIAKTNGNKSRAAQNLGITLRQLNYRLQKSRKKVSFLNSENARD
jgi:Nif-specific regulatory protein